MATSGGDPQGQGRDPFNMRTGVNVLHLVVETHAAAVTPFLRRGMGVNYPGVFGLLALVMIPLYAAATHDPLMITFLWVWLGAIIVRRAEAVQLARRGRVVHSRYNGWPWFSVKLPFVKTESAAKVADAMVCLVVGVLLCQWSIALGRFVMLGCVSLGMQRAIQGQVNSMRVRQMRDAAIEQRQLAEWYREQRIDF
jgi:hypothetical protein